MSASPDLALWFALLAAPCVGSFAALLADRWPRGEPIFWTRSRCDGCARPLGARDLAPVLSFALARGRARCCGVRLRAALPAAELAALGLVVWAALETAGPARIATIGLGWTLLTLSLVDLACLRLPDALTLPLGAAGLGLAAAGLSGPLLAHLGAAALGYGAVAATAFAWRRLRGVDGLGEGDARLLGAAGAWVGPDGLASVVVWACAAGLLYGAVAAARGRGGWGVAMPFGPPLALGFWATWLYGPLLIG